MSVCCWCAVAVSASVAAELLPITEQMAAEVKQIEQAEIPQGHEEEKKRHRREQGVRGWEMGENAC